MSTVIDGTLGVTYPDTGTQGKAAYPDSFYYAALGADVNLANTANYYDGPSVALPTGKWLVMAKASMTDPTGNAGFYGKLWDGTTVFDSGNATHPGSNNFTPLTCAAPVTVVAGPVTVKLSIRGVTSSSGKILYNQSGNGKDSSITAVRIG